MTHTELGLPVLIQTLIFHCNSPCGITGSPCSISSYAELCNFSKGMPFMHKYAHKHNEIEKKQVFHTATYDTDCKNKTCKLRRNFNFLPTRKNRFSVGQCSWLLSGCLWLNSPIKNWALRLSGSQKDKMADENIQCEIFLCGDPHTLEYWEGVGRSRCEQKNGYHKFHQW